MLIDSHCHVQSHEFDHERHDVLARACEAGVEAMVVVGWDAVSSAAAVAMAHEHSDIFAVVGCHPHDAASFDKAAFKAIQELAREPKVVAIGETGLDFYRNLSPIEAQFDAFVRQLELAAAEHMPVVIHSRAADYETFDILEPWARRVVSGWPAERPLGVMHCYAGDLELAKRYIEIGFFISIPGIVTYPKADKLVEVATEMPLTAMLVETDCPYLTPQSRRGRRNEPAYIRETVAKIAELRGEPFEEITIVTTANARRLFGIEAATVDAAGARKDSV